MVSAVAVPAQAGDVKALLGPRGEVLRRFTSTGPGVSAYNATRPGGTELMRFAPSLASADGDILPEKRELDAQARDNVRNDGYLSGARQVQDRKSVV